MILYSRPTTVVIMGNSFSILSKASTWQNSGSETSLWTIFSQPWQTTSAPTSLVARGTSDGLRRITSSGTFSRIAATTWRGGIHNGQQGTKDSLDRGGEGRVPRYSQENNGRRQAPRSETHL